MKFIPVVRAIAVAMLASSCASTPAAPPVPQTKAPQKLSATAYPVAVKSYKPDGGSAGSVTAAYSPQGLILRQQVFSSAGALVSSKAGAAVDGGWRIVETAASGAVLSIEDYALGPRGELLSLTRRSSGGRPMAVVEYQYDASGRLSVSLARTGDGRLKTRTVYSYDARGNNSRIEIFDGGGTLNTVYERQFEGGRVVVEKGSDASGAVVELIRTTWKDGRKVVQETVAPVARTVEYTYDGTDAPSAQVVSVRGRIVERQTFEYQWLTPR